MINTSCPGKIILFGEHAVVYDKLGIAATIDKRCKVGAFPVKEEKVFIISRDLKLKKSLGKKELFDFFDKINDLKKLREFDKIKEIAKKDELSPSFFVMASIFKEYGFKGLKIEINSEISKNLGSSSAVFSAISLGASKFLGKNISKKEISDFAFQGDLMAHGGTPSGIDNSVVTYGGYIKYRKSEGLSILDIDFKFPLLIVDSGERAQTGEMVSYVRKKREENPELVNRILNSLNDISEKALTSLKSKDFNNLGRLMTTYYQELKKLDISTPKLNKIIEIALENKALGAKPTGAWGGGCCLVLMESQDKMIDLIRVFKENGFNSFQSKIGVEGVKLI